MQYLGNREPPLDEVLDDPMVRLVIERDRLQLAEVREHVEAARRRLWELSDAGQSRQVPNQTR